MGTQSQDVPYFIDALTVLDEVGGPFSKRSGQAIRDAFIQVPDGPKRGRAPKNEDSREFEERCSKLYRSAVARFQVVLQQVGLDDCLSLAILLGQYDISAGTVTGSPNMFAYEMELIASCSRRRTTSPLHWHNRYRHALEALRLARRIHILDKHLTHVRSSMKSDHRLESYRAESGFQGRLETDTMTAHGSFNTRYDWDYCERLAHRLRLRGVAHPHVGLLAKLVSNVLDSWGPLITQFRQDAASIGGVLDKIATSFTLQDSSPGELSRAEVRIVALYARSLPMKGKQLLGGIPQGMDCSMRDWLNLMETPSASLGQNGSIHTVFELPFRSGPLLPRRRASEFLPTLLHYMTTDLSLMLERKFSKSVGEAYFSARAEEIEQSACKFALRMLPGAQSVLGGKYGSGKPGEAIEVDGVVLWRDVVFILESKGGFLTRQARFGNDEAAIADLRKTIGDGYFQASRLLLTLEREGEVFLVNNRNVGLTLRSNTIRRAYIIVPTADSLGGVTTSLERLWRNEVIPQRSIPLVIAVQDLQLMAHLFESRPLDLLAYLEYREEVLSNEEVLVADEQELLGNYLGGIDIIGNIEEKSSRYSFQSGRPEWGNLHPIFYVGTDAQEKYLNPWIYSSFQAFVEGSEAPEVPTRHAKKPRQIISELAEQKGHFWSAVNAMQISSDTFASAFDRDVEPRLGKPVILGAAGIAAVFISHRESFTKVKRTRLVQDARSAARYVMYVAKLGRLVTLRSVERGRKHNFFRDADGSLIERSRMGAVGGWFDHFAQHRKPSAPEPSAEGRLLELQLMDAGLSESTARGAVRLGMANVILRLTESGVPITRAANVWMTEIRRTAVWANWGPSAFPISAERLSEALSLVDAGTIDPDQLSHLVDLLASETISPAKDIAKQHNLVLSAGTNLVDAAVKAAAQVLSVDVQSFGEMGNKAQSRMRTRLIAEVKAGLESPNMKVVVQVVDEFLGSPESGNK